MIKARQHSIGDLPRRTAARYPDKLAVRFGETIWTYREFDEICNRLANGLIERGLVAGDRVAILSRNSHAFAALRFALARAGGVLVPIDSCSNAQEIAYILRSSGARALAVSDEFLDTGSKAAALDTSVSQALRLSAFDDLLSRDPHPPESPECDGLAQIVYTSGTESLPKGAMLTHDAVLWQYISCIVDAEIAASDVILHALPMYHCAQLDVFLGPAIYRGATNIIASSSPTPEIVMPLIAEHRITSFFAPPTVWIGLLRSPLSTSSIFVASKGLLRRLNHAGRGAARDQRRVPELRLWNLYGQTEIAPLATVLGPDDQLRKLGRAAGP